MPVLGPIAPPAFLESLYFLMWIKSLKILDSIDSKSIVGFEPHSPRFKPRVFKNQVFE